MSVTWVVKLGGSLARTAHLPAWLEALSIGGLVLVPGGGVFADTVREAQERWCFDDGTAHAMAITAMRQYGMMLAGLCSALVPAYGQAAIASALGADRPIIWLPDPFELPAEGPDATWDVTSDSLAVWLANQLDARNLLLVKCVTLPAGGATLSELVKKGIIDPAFPRHAGNMAQRCWVCGPDGYATLREGLMQPAGVFRPIIDA